MAAVSDRAKANNNRISLENYYAYKGSGICWKCKTRWVEPGRTYCEICKRRVKAEAERRDPGGEKRNAYNRDRRARLIAAGMCVTCGQAPAREGMRKCATCARKQNERSRMQRLLQKVREGKA